MKNIHILLIFIIIYSSKAWSSIDIDFSFYISSSQTYTVEGDVVTLNNTNTNYYYILKGKCLDKSIVIKTSCFVYLDSLTLISTGKLTPIIVEENVQVFLHIYGKTTLIDSYHNENDAVIYVKSGAKLVIEENGILNIMPNKRMAIMGENSTSLLIQDGNINIISSSTTVGGIYFCNEIRIFNGNLFYNALNGIYPAIGCKGSIMILRGSYNLNSGYGNGIHSNKNVYLGELFDNDSNLKINIITFSEGIKVKGLEIFSGNINIKSIGTGLQTSELNKEENCSGNCTYYMKFFAGCVVVNSGMEGIYSIGDIFIHGGNLIIFANSTKNGKLVESGGIFNISNGIVIIGGTKNSDYVNSSSIQISKVYIKHFDSNSNLKLIYNNRDIIFLDIQKDLEYLYLSYTNSSFIIKYNGNIIEESSPDVRTLIISEEEDKEEKDYESSIINEQSTAERTFQDFNILKEENKIVSSKDSTDKTNGKTTEKNDSIKDEGINNTDLAGNLIKKNIYLLFELILLIL